MKKWKSTSILYRYLLSYFSVILLSCAALGLFLFNASIRELNSAAKGESQNKLSLAAVDLENQQAVMGDIALTVATTLYYKPYYRARGKYYETVLIEDLAKFDGRSPIADDYFLLYEDDTWVFKKTAKNTFSVYAAETLGLVNSTALYDRLNGLEAFAVVLPEDPAADWVLFAYPVPISGLSQEAENACLCFVTHKGTLAQRVTDVAGQFSGTVEIEFDGQLIASLSDGSAAMSGEEPVLSASSPEGLFTVSVTPSGSAYTGLSYFLWINLIIVIVFVLLFLGLSAFLAYRNYRPIRELAARYDIPDEAAAERRDELRYIDSLLRNVLEKQRTSQTHLKKQFSLLKRQQLLLLLSGGYGGDTGEGNDDPDLPLPGPYFGVLVIRTTQALPGGADAFCRLIEDLSDEGRVLYAVELKQENCFAVLTGLGEEPQMDEAAELIGEVMSASSLDYELGIGPLYHDVRRLPASLLAALSSCAAPGKADPVRPAANPPARWYDDDPVVRMIAAAHSGRAEDARAQLDLFARNMETAAPSLILRRCIFSDVLNRLIRASYESHLPIAQGRIGSLLTARDPAVFYDGMRSLIDELCAEVSARSRRHNDEMLSGILIYIEAHALEYDLSQRNVAQHFNLTDNQLYRIIKNGTGKTYQDYLTMLRIRRAKTFLIEDDLSVSETCQRVGYINISHFIKKFKKITGHTPASYKKLI